MKKIAAILLVTVVLAFSVSAQGATLLSNMSNTTVRGYGGGPDSADHFQTGSEAFTVTGVNVLWDSADQDVNQVLIYTDAGGLPSSTTVGTPFTNAAATTVGVMTYVGTAELVPGTVYWMVVDQTGESQVAFTRDNSFVSAPSTGGAQMLAGSAWGNNETSAWNDDSADLKFELVGDSHGREAVTSIPSLNTWGMAVLLLLLMLTVVYRRRQLF